MKDKKQDWNNTRLKKLDWYLIRLVMGIFFIYSGGFCIGSNNMIVGLICLIIGSLSIPLDYFENYERRKKRVG